MNNTQTSASPVTIARWLFVCCGFVFAMVIIGAITRLTESGLSITEWRPLIGAIPPLNDADWQHQFDLYKQTPEFQKKNFWMTMTDFKTIYFWEWFHRLWGRLIGLVYALPLMWFWARGMIPQGYKLKLFGLLILGGLQGAMGWYMVKSGLIDEPAVSHYRLAAHLSLAFVLFSLMLWLGLGLIQKNKNQGDKILYGHGWFTLFFIIITIVWGAFVAGLDAGLIYNDHFPKMTADSWLPPDLWHLTPTWINFIENHGGVQLVHRWLAMLTVLMVAVFWVHGVRRKHNFAALHGVMIMVLLQLSLGIITLLTKVWLPVAVLHQAGALILLGLMVACLHRLRPISIY
jgi:cytochrome c oxidase assembly protein subunit 15